MTPEELESAKTALRKLILDMDSWDKLEYYADKQNILKILSIERMEIRHSNILAWLLDPSANHKLGDVFLKKFLFRYAQNSNTGVDVFDIDGLDFDDALVYRELHHMDIIVQSEKSKFILVVENKIKSAEGINQTTKYRKYIEEHYANVTNKFFAYLTLDQSEAEDSQWTPICYSELIPDLDSLLVRMSPKSPGKLLLSDYVEVLKEMAGDEETELQALCRKIYSDHKEAIKILMENIPDEFQLRADTIKKILKEKQNLILRDSNNSYIRFTTPLVLDKFGLIGSDKWVSGHDIVLFEIQNNRNGDVKFMLTVGPAEDPEKRKLLINYFTGKWQKKTNYTETYSRVFSKKFKINEENDEEEQLRKNIDEFLVKTMPEKINPVIEAFKGFNNTLPTD